MARNNNNNNNMLTTPSMPGFMIPPVQGLPSPASAQSSRPRTSLNTSFSFGPDSFNNSGFALNPNRSILGHSPRGARSLHGYAKQKARAHPLANDTTDIFTDANDSTGTGVQQPDPSVLDYDDDVDEEGGENEEAHDWDAVDRMRLWRHDALMQHLYETAAFWGDKLVSWTNDPNDAFWLAQTYFHMHQYARAERILTRPFRTKPNRSGPAAAQDNTTDLAQSRRRQSTVQHANGTTLNNTAAGAYFGNGPDVAIAPTRLPVGPAAMIDVAAEELEGVSRLVDMSIACRYLCAQALSRQGRWRDALEMLGESNPFKSSARSGPGVRNVDGGIKIEASMCYLRGTLMLKTNRSAQAKTCFAEALALDVKCVDAFLQLVGGEMMGPDEEWEFVQGLQYASQAPEDAEFIRLMYISRLRKHAHTDEHTTARRLLVDRFGLGDNPDILWAFADALYTQFQWADCFAVTERILGLVASHTPTMPLHIACMFHLKHLHSRLFVLAHELVEREPEAPLAWYAVGVWYLAQGRWAEARTYFSKTSLMDPRFAPSWVAYAHTFSFEKEHDQAIVAYSSAARNYAGSHLPLLFVGMEHIMLSNHDEADEALGAASKLCADDPLLANEMGVMRFNHADYVGAAKLFERALELAKASQGAQTVWATTDLNLGTAYRKLGRYKAAKAAYKRVLEILPAHPTALAFLGLTCHLTGEMDKAILHYHEALSVDPINHHVLELLNKALVKQSEIDYVTQSEVQVAVREKGSAAFADERSLGPARAMKPVSGQAEKKKGGGAKGKARAGRTTEDNAMQVG